MRSLEPFIRRDASLPQVGVSTHHVAGRDVGMVDEGG